MRNNRWIFDGVGIQDIQDKWRLSNEFWTAGFVYVGKWWHPSGKLLLWILDPLASFRRTIPPVTQLVSTESNCLQNTLFLIYIWLTVAKRSVARCIHVQLYFGNKVIEWSEAALHKEIMSHLTQQCCYSSMIVTDDFTKWSSELTA